jgi:hypothetical protein
MVKYADQWEPLGDFGIVKDTDVAGGFHVVDNEAARLAIPLARQKVGMVVHQVSPDAYYRLSATGEPPTYAQLITTDIAGTLFVNNIETFGTITSEAKITGFGAGTDASPQPGVIGEGRPTNAASTTAGAGVSGVGGAASHLSGTGGPGVAGVGGNSATGLGGPGVLGEGAAGGGIGVFGQGRDTGGGVEGRGSGTSSVSPGGRFIGNGGPGVISIGRIEVYESGGGRERVNAINTPVAVALVVNATLASGFGLTPSHPGTEYLLVTLDQPLSSENYVVNVTIRDAFAGGVTSVFSDSDSQFRVYTKDMSGTFVNPSLLSYMITVYDTLDI